MVCWPVSYGERPQCLPLGINFPFPFLGNKPNDEDPRRAHCYPVPTTLQALFSTTPESREFCRSIYVPFAYTYAHPSLDTLYIPSRRDGIPYSRLMSFRKCARPPLYPVSLLDRVAIELNAENLPPPTETSVRWIVCLLCTMLAILGTPKEVLVVSAKPEVPLLDEAYSTSLRGWKSIELVEDEQMDQSEEAIAKREKLEEYVWRALKRSSDNALVQWRRPTIRCVEALKKDYIYVTQEQLLGLKGAAEKIREEWNNMGFAINGREWDWNVDGSPYDLNYMMRALKTAGINLR